MRGVAPRQLEAFVERAERHGFDSVWVLDRVVWEGMSTLSLLAWVAARSERVKIGTCVLIAPLYSPLILAKEVATIDALSGGRVILGLGIGPRDDDFEASAVPMARRGLRMQETLHLLRQTWSGQPIDHRGQIFQIQVGAVGPAPAQSGGPPIWLGGSHPDAIRRAVEMGDGYLCSCRAPSATCAKLQRVRDAVTKLGHDPTSFACSALAFYNLGRDRDRCAQELGAHLMHYYGRAIVDPYREAIVGPTADAVERLREYDGLGLHTLILNPSSTDPEQVDRLAEAVSAYRARSGAPSTTTA